MIFPNPASDYVRIANFEPGDEDAVLNIYDISGKLCQEIKLSGLDLRKVEIKLVPGMYIAQIATGSTVQHVQKLVVV